MLVDSVVSVGTMCRPSESVKEFFESSVAQPNSPLPNPPVCNKSVNDYIWEDSYVLGFHGPSYWSQ